MVNKDDDEPDPFAAPKDRVEAGQTVSGDRITVNRRANPARQDQRPGAGISPLDAPHAARPGSVPPLFGGNQLNLNTG